jgi:hypothetical protein
MMASLESSGPVFANFPHSRHRTAQVTDIKFRLDIDGGHKTPMKNLYLLK